MRMAGARIGIAALYRQGSGQEPRTRTTCDVLDSAAEPFEAFVVTFQDRTDGHISAQFAAQELDEAQLWRDRTERALGSAAHHTIAFFTRSTNSGKVVCGWSCRSSQSIRAR